MKTTEKKSYKILWRTIKPLRRRVLIEEGLARSYKSSTQRTQTSGIFVKQVVFRMVNHHGPVPLKELHSTGETIVWRDPGGSWAYLLPVYDCGWNRPATGCDMWTTPKKHIKKTEILGNAKTKGELGTRRCMTPPPPPPNPHRKDSKLKEPYEMLNKTKTLTTIAR